MADPRHYAPSAQDTRLGIGPVGPRIGVYDERLPW
jgi:hypothetical protein